MVYRDIHHVGTDEELDEYISELWEDLESKPIEVLEGRILVEMKGYREDGQRQDVLDVVPKRRQIIRSLLKQYFDRTEPHEVNPVYVGLLATFFKFNPSSGEWEEPV